ncbi:MAG: hypothetical protein ACP5QR_05070 [Rhizomicrobium sp.]
MTIPAFYVIVCETPPDPRAEVQGRGLFVAEFEIPERDETTADAIRRISEQIFPVAHILRNDHDVSTLVAMQWLHGLKRDGWTPGDPLPDFIWRHIPASYDVGHRNGAAE